MNINDSSMKKDGFLENKKPEIRILGNEKMTYILREEDYSVKEEKRDFNMKEASVEKKEKWIPHCVQAAFFFMLILLSVNSSVFSEKFIMGGKAGWKNIQSLDGITTGRGRYGYECLELDSNAHKGNQFTDMLVNFEDGRIIDSTGNYKVLSNSLYSHSKSKMGKNCAQSRNNSTGLILSGKDGSFFGTNGPAGSFLIDFWLNPSTVENGEVILNWRSSRNVMGTLLYQLIQIEFAQGKVLATFSNIFDGYTFNKGDINLYSNRKIIPNRWARHSLAYQEDTGILEYRIDGELECIKYVTSTQHENGEIYPAVMGLNADVKICPSYTGFIDDFRVMRSYFEIAREVTDEQDEALRESHYKINGGRFVSEPILTKTGSIMNSISAEMNVPGQTEIQLYVRGGDNFYNWDDNYPKWIPVSSGEKIEGLTGLYFQVAADLYPDGAGMHSPSLTQITMDYTVLPDPLPPFTVKAEKGDGSVTLKWTYSVDDTAGGYYIYYGNRPGEYLGRIAMEGESPINAGNATSYTLTGLNNGTIYYFAISTYSKLDSRVCGPLSKEVYARPTAK